MRTRTIHLITVILILCSGKLKNMIAPIKKVDPDTIFLGNGSDEAIDLVYRAFCIPGGG